MLLGMSQFPLQKFHCYQDCDNMLVTIHCTQPISMSNSEAESKYFINFPILQQEHVILIHI